MKVTVCQLHEPPEHLEAEWRQLVQHVAAAGSDLVLLPEMPFHPWLARSREVDEAAWRLAVEAHDEWIERLTELAPAVVLGTRPVVRGDRRLNEGFVYDASGDHAVHQKFYLPDEEMFWEASWYARGDGAFEPAAAGKARVGFLICTEMWFAERAREYGRAGVHLLAAPRATPGLNPDRWISGGRAAAVVSGAYCLSSNRGGLDNRGAIWGGAGWIIEPEEGEILAVTSSDEPFLTREISLAAAESAKTSYPRYVEP